VGVYAAEPAAAWEMVMTRYFVKLMDSPATDELMRFPEAFVLLALVARRARRGWSERRLESDGLQAGQALIGDYATSGLTARKYRTAKKRLAKMGLATFKPTNKGTVATLMDSRVFSLAAAASDKQSDRQDAEKRQASDKQATSEETTNIEGEEGEKGRREEHRERVWTAEERVEGFERMRKCLWLRNVPAEAWGRAVQMVAGETERLRKRGVGLVDLVDAVREQADLLTYELDSPGEWFAARLRKVVAGELGEKKAAPRDRGEVVGNAEFFSRADTARVGWRRKPGGGYEREVIG